VRKIALLLLTAVFVGVSFAADGGIRTQPPPKPLKSGEDVHIDVYKRLNLAVVGITCLPKEATNTVGGYYGTGVVVTPDGLVLTDTTVIPKDAKDIKIFFADGTIKPATFVAYDGPSEGALIKFEGKNQVCMPLADSAKYQVGDPVYSWGNPHFTIQRDGIVSLSAGSISGIYQVSSVDDQSRYIGPVIETDAAVNPGSDGGPLTDAEGNLLGIMSLGFSRTRWLGMAIPTHRMVEAFAELKKLPLAKRPELHGDKAAPFVRTLAFQQASAVPGKSTVGVRVVFEGETDDVPENRAKEVLKELKEYPRDAERAPYEAKRPPQSVSSGFIVDAEGLVLTAAHNLDCPDKPAAKITKLYVFLADGTRVAAHVVAKDSSYDMALLKLEGAATAKYPAVEFAKIDALDQGKAVAVLGRSEAPGTLTLNSGTVSGRTRFPGYSTQISALINYGNLGGPVIDLEGKVLGITSRLNEKTPWRQNCGVGFMVDAAVIQRVLPDLKAGKTSKRPILGVTADPNVNGVQGAKVGSVQPNSAAEKAGMKPGDVIVEFNGQMVVDFMGLVGDIQRVKLGDTVKMKIKRGQELVSLDVLLSQAAE